MVSKHARQAARRALHEGLAYLAGHGISLSEMSLEDQLHVIHSWIGYQICPPCGDDCRFWVEHAGVCALEEAKEGPQSFAAIGRKMGLTRERVRQIFRAAATKIQDRLEDSPFIAEERVSTAVMSRVLMAAEAADTASRSAVRCEDCSGWIREGCGYWESRELDEHGAWHTVRRCRLCAGG